MIGVRVRAQARAHARSWILWAVLVGLAGGVPLAAVAGARRTQSAYDRFLDATDAFDVLVVNGATSPTNLNRQFDFDEIADRPEVDASGLLYYFAAYGVTEAGRPITPQDLSPLAPVDGRFGTEFSTLPMIEGRLPEAEDEIALSPLTADRLGVGTGDELPMDLVSATEEIATAGLGDHAEPTTTFRVSGIVAVQGGFPPLSGGLPPPAILSREYAVAHAEDGAEILAVRLNQGTTSAAFVDDLQRLGAPDQVVTGEREEFTAQVQRGLDVQATALRVFAGLVGVIALLLLFQSLRRRMAVDAFDDPIWRALGATAHELRRSRVLLGLLAAPIVAVVAVLTAAGLSTLFPVGVARDVEVEPGVDLDPAVFAVGVGLVIVVLVALLVSAAWWQATVDRPGRVRRAPWLAPKLASSGLPLTAATGMAMAMDAGRGSRAVPLRSTMVSVGVGIAAIAGVLVFSTSLQRLLDEPRLYGWGWDIQVGDAFASSRVDLAEALAEDPAVEAVALATQDRVTVDDDNLDALAIEPGGGIDPTVVEGVVPAGPDEIMLGARTARRLGVDVGETTTVRLGDSTARVRVVGFGVFPSFGGSSGLGEGVELTLDGIRALAPDAEGDTVLVRVVPGPAGDELLRDLQTNQPGNIYVPSKPTDLDALQRLGGLPSLVALFLAAAGLLALVTTLLASVRRRRATLGTVKALGLLRRQVGAIVLWQAVSVVVVAAVVAVPVGVVGGRLLWTLFAERLGVPRESALPAGELVALVAVAVVASLLVALGPAVRAARLRPGSALRAE